MDPKLESLLRREETMDGPKIRFLLERMSRVYEKGMHYMIDKKLNENSDFKIDKQQIFDSLKSYDAPKFKCGKVLEELENQSSLNDQETLVLGLLNNSKDSFENYEKAVCLRRPQFPKNLPELDKYFDRSGYFDWDGSPMKMWEWSFKKQYFTHHIDDTLVKGWRVSTIWLGLNHAWGSGTHIFETMIFKEDEEQEENDYIDHYQERYACYDHALARHKEICKLLEEGKFEELREDDA